MESQEVEVCDNRLRLFVETEEFIASLIEDIHAAQSRVWIESYIIADDELGRSVAAALKERATAGVQCRVIYDFVGSYSTPNAYFEELRLAGVEVAAFRPLKSVLWSFKFFQHFNRRDHRKLAIVDDRVAYFGGMNIVDQRKYEAESPQKVRSLIASSGWRDVHARLEGPQQPDVAAAFDHLWSRLHRLPRKRGRRWPIKEIVDSRGEGIWFFDSRPQRVYRRPVRVLRPLLRGARKSITLAMAYFVPWGSVLRELIRAERRGIEIRVIVPAHSDVRIVEWASRHIYERLLRHGIRIYERQDRMLHSKVLTIDGQWSVIGSCNIDPRSFLLNLEFMAVIRSAEMAAAVERICQQELQDSRPVEIGYSERHSWWQRWLHRLAWYLRRWI